MTDVLGRARDASRAMNGDVLNDRRSRAIANFMFLMQYQRDLTDARAMIATKYPGNETRIDQDIAQANIALRDAALELEASRA